MPDPLIPIPTLRYKTYVLEALTEALSSVFANHPDTTTMRGLKVTGDLPQDQAEFPSVVVRFYERSLRNIGVGHEEWIEKPGTAGIYYRVKHLMYKGDIEFAIYALSSYDRDLISDALQQALMMADIEGYTQSFLTRIYGPNIFQKPTALEHFINLNTDEVQGFGQTQQLAPWLVEDVMVYQASYRIGIMGELYSRIPADSAPTGTISGVNVFPYNPWINEPVPEPEPTNPNPWISGTWWTS
jgi:hypothetical protein